MFRYRECENVLMSYAHDHADDTRNIVSTVEAAFGRYACYALALLAGVHRRADRNEVAASTALRAAQLNPHLYSAMHTFCDTGEQSSFVRFGPNLMQPPTHKSPNSKVW